MQTVNGLMRGLEILRLLNEDSIRYVKQLHEATRLPKSTIIRMLDTLQAAGYVLKRERGGYQVTAKVLSLANGYNATNDLMQVAQPILNDFRKQYIWPIDMAIFDHDAMVIVDTGKTPGTMTLNRTIGSRLPIMVTAFGRAYLAHCSSEILESTLNVLSRSSNPQEALSRNREAVDKLLENVRKKGYGISDQEYRAKSRAVAVPVLMYDEVIACINMIVIASSMKMEHIENKFVKPLKDTAKLIAQEMSSHQFIKQRIG